MEDRFDKDWWEREKRKLEKRFPDSEFVSSQERLPSKEYIDFIKGAKTGNKNWYTSLCRLFKNIKINPSGGLQRKLENAIRLLDWDITPGQCVTLSIFMSFLLGIPAFLLLFTGIPFVFRMLALLIPVISLYFFLYYPHLKAQEKIVKGSEDLIFCVLYMIIYTYSSPNLEGAVLFSAMNLKGTLSEDLKKVLWDVEVGKYSTIDDALGEYISRWEPYNRDFLQSVQLIKGAMLEPLSERRHEFLTEASNTILQGTKEKMKHYSQDLKMPVMVLNGLGILLPVLGMVALPLSSIFLESTIKLSYLVVIYNIIIPSTIYFVMLRVLMKRPPTTSVKPLQKGEMPPKGKITINVGKAKLRIPAVILSLIFFFALGFMGILGMIQNPLKQEPTIGNLAKGLFLILGVGIGIGSYFYFGYRQRYNKQKELKEIEEQFPAALFELGHRLQEGKPIEVSLDYAAYAIRNLSISNFFRIISNNIKNVGMTFKDAVFDSQMGALRKYPSKLIETVMKAIIDAARKGTSVVSQTMITISVYLQNLHKTQEEITDLMEESTTTMKFVGFMLAPVIAGVAVSMTQIMTQALKMLKEKFADIGQIGGTNNGFGGGSGLLTGLIKLQDMIPPHILQLIVGFYIVEILIIIGIFYTRVREGENSTAEKMNIGKLLIIGSIVYALTTLIISALFGSILKTITF